ncbi:MAG: hypothetical protein ACT4PG_08075, partial [Panacagrimonas sp.]
AGIPRNARPTSLGMGGRLASESVADLARNTHTARSTCPKPAWEVETRPYILERAVPFRERFSQDHSKRIVLRMQVASLDDVVEVPAGTFTRCLQLEGSGLLNVLADARIGASPVPVTHTEWYAPGVGLVKLERTEWLDTQQIVGGKISMELLRFDD